MDQFISRVDKSVKTASVTTEKGVDGNKKVNGRKRFILTDTLGLMMGILIVAANALRAGGSGKSLQSSAGKISEIAESIGRSRL